MTIVKWLNSNGILIYSELAGAMASFEFRNPDYIELGDEFIRELVNFTKEALKNPDNFYHDNDKASVIYNLISENCASLNLQFAIDKMQDKLHKIKVGDEIDNLMVQVISCTIQTCDK